MSTHSPDPGWYDDPHVALKLRWWDGHRWTHHTRAKPVTQHPETEQRFSRSTPVDPTLVPPYRGAPIVTAIIEVAEPAAHSPYSYTAPESLTPASPPPGSVAAASVASASAASAPVTSAPVTSTPVGSLSAASPYSAGSAAAPHSPETPGASASRRAGRTAHEYVPDRAAGIALWAIAASPLLVLLGALAGFVGTDALTALLIVMGVFVLPTLWLIAFAVRDRAALRAWGHARRPSLWWLLLGPVGYLGARVAALRHRRTSTVVALVVCLAAIVAVATAAPTLIALALVA